MKEEYAVCVNKRYMPKIFSKLMKAYHVLSKHPKFEVEFQRGGSRPPPKHPNSIRKTNQPSLEQIVGNSESNTFMSAPARIDRPAG